MISDGGSTKPLRPFGRSSTVYDSASASLATRVLELGVSVVFDFAANTARDRAWVRSIFEAAGADHVLHVLDVPVDECRRRLHERNAAQPPGLYFGHVADDLFDRIVPLIVPPAPDEGFCVALVRQLEPD